MAVHCASSAKIFAVSSIDVAPFPLLKIIIWQFDTTDANIFSYQESIKKEVFCCKIGVTST